MPALNHVAAIQNQFQHLRSVAIGENGSEAWTTFLSHENGITNSVDLAHAR